MYYINNLVMSSIEMVRPRLLVGHLLNRRREYGTNSKKLMQYRFKDLVASCYCLSLVSYNVKEKIAIFIHPI